MSAADVRETNQLRVQEADTPEDAIRIAARAAAGLGVPGLFHPGLDEAGMAAIWLTMVTTIAKRCGARLTPATAGKFVTAGAALSHIDLALWLVRSASPTLASLTAKYLIVDSRPSQSAYALADHLVHSDPVVQRFESWARSRLKHGFSLDDAAKAVGSSKRTLARRIQTVLGKSPLAYFQSLRVERAVHLLKTSSASVDEIAERVGYTEGSILRLLLRRRLGLGIKEIRRAA